MKNLLYLCFILIFALPIFAQEAEDSGSPSVDDSGFVNDPNINPDANACFEGGRMAGQCNIDFDNDGVVHQYEIDWAWECGWYMIRYDFNLFNSDNIPHRCNSLVPSTQTTLCFNRNGYGESWELLRTDNTLGNTRYYLSPDCHGDGVIDGKTMLVIADSIGEAKAICNSRGATYFVGRIADNHYSAPRNVYYCYKV